MRSHPRRRAGRCLGAALALLLAAESRDTESPVPDELFTVRALERERLGSRLPLPTPGAP